MKRSHYDISSEAAFYHGAHLHHLAINAYHATGYEDAQGLSAHFISDSLLYAVTMRNQREVSLRERLRSDYLNYFDLAIGRAATHGLIMETRVISLDTSEHAFTVMRNQPKTNKTNQFSTNIVRYDHINPHRHAHVQVVNDPELGLEFCHQLLELGREHLVMKPEELPNREVVEERYRTIVESFFAIAHDMDVATSELNSSGGAINFWLSDTVEARIYYTTDSSEDDVSRAQQKVSMIVHDVGSAKEIALTAASVHHDDAPLLSVQANLRDIRKHGQNVPKPLTSADVDALVHILQTLVSHSSRATYASYDSRLSAVRDSSHENERIVADGVLGSDFIRFASMLRR